MSLGSKIERERDKITNIPITQRKNNVSVHYNTTIGKLLKLQVCDENNKKRKNFSLSAANVTHLSTTPSTNFYPSMSLAVDLN